MRFNTQREYQEHVRQSRYFDASMNDENTQERCNECDQWTWHCDGAHWTFKAVGHERFYCIECYKKLKEAYDNEE